MKSLKEGFSEQMDILAKMGRVIPDSDREHWFTLYMIGASAFLERLVENPQEAITEVRRWGEAFDITNAEAAERVDKQLRDLGIRK